MAFLVLSVCARLRCSRFAHLPVHRQSPQPGLALHARTLGRAHRTLHVSYGCRTVLPRAGSHLRHRISVVRDAGAGAGGIGGNSTGNRIPQRGASTAWRRRPVALAHALLVGQRRCHAALHRLGRRRAFARVSPDEGAQRLAAHHIYRSLGVLSVHRQCGPGAHVVSVGLAARRSWLSRHLSSTGEAARLALALAVVPPDVRIGSCETPQRRSCLASPHRTKFPLRNPAAAHAFSLVHASGARLVPD